MTVKFKALVKFITLFLCGGLAYYGIEIAWRGYSHPSMFILGGVCFLVIGGINERPTKQHIGLICQGCVGAVVITILELLTGLIVNTWLKLNVWDYSDVPLNFMGQICLPFTVLWFFISILAVIADDLIRHILYGEPIPHYTLR